VLHTAQKDCRIIVEIFHYKIAKNIVKCCYNIVVTLVFNFENSLLQEINIKNQY